jgi:hypothetical protein
MEEQWTIYKIDERNSNEIGQFEMSGLLEHLRSTSISQFTNQIQDNPIQLDLWPHLDIALNSNNWNEPSPFSPLLKSSPTTKAIQPTIIRSIIH